jgi:hypothetical protein
LTIYSSPVPISDELSASLVVFGVSVGEGVLVGDSAIPVACTICWAGVSSIEAAELSAVGSIVVPGDGLASGGALAAGVGDWVEGAVPVPHISASARQPRAVAAGPSKRKRTTRANPLNAADCQVLAVAVLPDANAIQI